MAGYKGKQGRKPKASTIVERERQQGRAQPVARRLPKMPAHLIGVAKVEWRRMGRLLRDVSLLTDLDTTALAAYCTAYARHVEAEAMLQGPAGYCPNCDPRLEDGGGEGPSCRGVSHVAPEYGMVIKGRLGKIGPSPYVAIGDKAMAQMIRILGEFGMTPASRSRIPKKAEEKHQRPAPPAVQPTGTPVDPREALNWSVQAGKN